MGQEANPLSRMWLSTSCNLSVCNKHHTVIQRTYSSEIRWAEETRTKWSEQLKESNMILAQRHVYFTHKRSFSPLSQNLFLVAYRVLSLLRVAIIFSKDGHNSISCTHVRIEPCHNPIKRGSLCPLSLSLCESLWLPQTTPHGGNDTIWH